MLAALIFSGDPPETKSFVDEQKQRKPGNGHHQSPTVLVVEDDVLVRLPVAEFLRDCGYRVIETSNAAEAKSVLMSREPVELVFSDVNMPGEMSGFDLVTWIRQQYPDIRIILTSGAPDMIAEAPLHNQSHELFLAKPYTCVTLEKSIKKLLGQ